MRRIVVVTKSDVNEFNVAEYLVHLLPGWVKIYTQDTEGNNFHSAYPREEVLRIYLATD